MERTLSCLFFLTNQIAQQFNLLRHNSQASNVGGKIPFNSSIFRLSVLTVRLWMCDEWFPVSHDW